MKPIEEISKRTRYFYLSVLFFPTLSLHIPFNNTTHYFYNFFHLQFLNNINMCIYRITFLYFHTWKSDTPTTYNQPPTTNTLQPTTELHHNKRHTTNNTQIISAAASFSYIFFYLSGDYRNKYRLTDFLH